jgi:hypothetical protein
LRYVPFRPSHLKDPADRKWFAEWLRRARRATREVIADVDAGKPITFKQKIWSELKAFLLKGPFNGKCAYCESRVTTTDFGDAEHYRPKGGITRKQDEKNVPVEYDGKPHPGYYWLAYDWRNLLPACGQCNSGEGKMNQFPISRTAHAMSHEVARTPRGLDALEGPMLLHPYYHPHPEKYLRFGEDGTVAAAEDDVTLLGQSSIETYNLKRGDLGISRHEYQEMAWQDLLKALSNDAPISIALKKYDSGEAPYSQACIQYVRLKYKRRASELGLV